MAAMVGDNKYPGVSEELNRRHNLRDRLRLDHLVWHNKYFHFYCLTIQE